jgi:hypothetical protein
MREDRRRWQLIAAAERDVAGAVDAAVEVEDAVVAQFLVAGAVTSRDLGGGDEAPAALKEDCEAGIAVERSWPHRCTGSSAA